MNLFHGRRCLQAYGSFSMLGVLGAFSASAALAQVTPDTTLGVEVSTVIREVGVRDQTVDLIDGGALRGRNLFHSFAEFSIADTQRVYFANPAGVENILSRVTGSNGSNIMGTLGVDGGANLFLLNPNGIIFGPNAQLDISGSFLASTADSFIFADGAAFSATASPSPELLSVAVPLGVQWGPGTGRGIVNAGNLAVGQDLTLSGASVNSTGQLFAPSGQLIVQAAAGNVQVQDALAETATFSASNTLILHDSQIQTLGDLNLLASDAVQVRDSADNPFIAYSGGNLLIQGEQNIDIFALNHPSSGLVAGGSMVLRSANTVSGDAHYWTGGSFSVEQLNSDLGNLFSPYDPVIRSAGDVRFGSYSGASLHIFAGGSVTIDGTVTITGSDSINGIFQENIPLSNPVDISGSENRPTTVTINGRERRTLDIRAGTTESFPPGLTPTLPSFPGNDNRGISNIISPTDINTNNPRTTADITIGGIDAEQVFLTNQYSSNGLPGSIRVLNGLMVPSPSPSDPSRTEAVSIRAFGALTIDSNGDIEILGRVNSDNRDISGADVLLLSGGEIRTQNITSGSQGGNAGSIIFNAARNIFTFGSISSDVSDFGGNANTGNASFINFFSEGSIFAEDLIVSTNVNTLGGNGGDILLVARDKIVTGSGSSGITNFAFGSEEVFFGVGSFALSGNSGNIELRSLEDAIDTRRGAIISRAFSDGGQAGSVLINAPFDIRIGDVSATSLSDNLRPEGINSVTINSSQGSVFLDNVTVSVDNSGGGFAGDINISSANEVRATNSSISSNGNFGIIFINTDSLFLQRSNISTVSSGAGESSGLINIKVNGTLLRLEDGSKITAEAAEGSSGGNIFIEIPNGFLLTRPSSNSDILASAVGGAGGNIRVMANAIFGIEERNPTTEFSSDFNASSAVNVDGTILLITLGIDPSRGLAELPVDVIDVSGLVATGCVGGDRSGVEDQGEFSVTGRGGVAQGPAEAIAPSGSLPTPATLDDDSLGDRPATLPPLDTEPIPRPVEAQGFAKNAQGRTAIVAEGGVNSANPASRAALNCDVL